MNPEVKIWRLTIILAIGFYFNYILITGADEAFIFDTIILLIIGFIFLVAFIWTIYKDIKDYRFTKSSLSLLPTFAGLLIIVSIVITNYLLDARDSSPLLIQAGYDGGYNGAWFEFREDRTYKFANSSGIGASYFRGTYRLNDSLIILDKSNIDNVIQSKRLAIREVNGFDSTKVKMLYQINDRHEIIDKEFAFRVNEDNRTK